MKKLSTFFPGLVRVLLALLMIYGGIMTSISPIEPLGGTLGFLFQNRITLVAYGIAFFSCGAAILYGMVFKNRKWVSRGLMMTYLIVLFALFSEWLALGALTTVLDNVIVAAVAAALYLHWKFKTEWLSAKDVAALRREAAQLREKP